MGRSCLALVLAFPCLWGCTSLQDLDVEYRDCVDVGGTRYAETFDDSDLATLEDRCWHVDNLGLAPAGRDKKLFVEDGDLVVRVTDPGSGTDGDQWTANDQAPFVYRELDGDFLVVARAEAIGAASNDHCLAPGNVAGIALRRATERDVWATWTVEPHLWVVGPKQASCLDDTDETNNATATARLAGSEPGFASATFADIGADGEADLAVCRVQDEVHYFYGRATVDPRKDEWLPLGTAVVSHALGPGPLEVGATAAGKAPSFQVAGHFTLMVFERGPWGDGCAGALEQLELPKED
ncbi:MAG: hypothetical protein IT377_13760 [Polyangiaceae bacterium]|nr:hypothetical protein [Polyangiaceae bacterium]